MSKRSSGGKTPRPKQRQRIDVVDEVNSVDTVAYNFAVALSTIAISYFDEYAKALQVYFAQKEKRAFSDYLPDDKDPDVLVSCTKTHANYVVNGVWVSKDPFVLINQLLATFRAKLETMYNYTSAEIIVTNDFNFWAIASSGVVTFLNDSLQRFGKPLTSSDPFCVSALQTAIQYLLHEDNDEERNDAVIALYPKGTVLYDATEPDSQLLVNIENAIQIIEADTLIIVTLSWQPTSMFYVYCGAFAEYNIAPYKLARLKRKPVKPVQVRGLLIQKGGTCQSNVVVNIILSVPALLHYCYAQIGKQQRKGEWMVAPIASVSDALLRTIYKQSCAGLALDSCPEEMFYMRHILRFELGGTTDSILHAFMALGISSQLKVTSKKLPVREKKYILSACLIRFNVLGRESNHVIAGILVDSEPWIYDSHDKYSKLDWRVNDNEQFANAMVANYKKTFTFCERKFIYIHKDFLRKYVAPVVICEPKEADEERYELRSKEEVASRPLIFLQWTCTQRIC